MSFPTLYVLCIVYLSSVLFNVIKPNPSTSSISKRSSQPVVIVISFDGFRYDYLEKVGKPTPNFNKFLKNGVRAKWMKNVFVTKTFPNHFSIATGLYEEIHGIVGNNMYDPVLNETFTMTNANPLWWDNGFNTPIWIANEIADGNRRSGSVMWAGANVPFRSHSASYFMPFNSSVRWTDRVDKALEWITLDENPANLVMIYIEEPDAIGHQYGPDSLQVKEKIMEADSLVGYLMDEMDKKFLTDKAHVIILSDHGMANMNHEIEMDKILNRSSYKAFGHTPVWNILPAQGMENYVYDKLLEGSRLYSYTLYKKEDIPEEYHFKHNRRVLNFLVVADVSYDLVFTKTLDRNTTTWGQHGYNNSFIEMNPIFMAKGPLFKKNFVSEPFMNLDVYPLICHILGISVPPNNGSINNVKQLLIPYGLVEEALGGSWVVAIVYMVCILISGTLTYSAIKIACNSHAPTVAYVTLRRQHNLRDREMTLIEEKEQLLMNEEAPAD